MKKRYSTQLQLLLGLILLVLVIVFPPQGLGLVIVIPVLGFLSVRVLANLFAKNGQFSYNWLSTRLSRPFKQGRSPSASRPTIRRAIPPAEEWFETNLSVWLIAWVAMTLLLYTALADLARIYYSGLDSAILLPVDSVYWGGLAMVAAAPVSLVVSQIGMRLLLRARYDEYVQQLQERFGFDLAHMLTLLVVGTFAVLALLVVPGLTTYTRFSVSGIATRSLFNIRENVRPYAEVQSIKYVTLPGPTRRGAPTAYFDIAFADGTEWTSPHFDSRSVPPPYWDAVNYAAKQSEHEIQRIAYSDALAGNGLIWPIGIVDDDTAYATRTVAQGNYSWHVQSKADTTLYETANMSPVGDFQLDMDCQRLDGSEAALCGTIFRMDAGDYYLFLIGQDQTIRLYLHYHDWIALIQPRVTTAVKPDAVNHITVNGVGSHFSFLVNGQVVAEADDSTLHSGTAGVALQLPANDEATVQFSHLEVLEK